MKKLSDIKNLEELALLRQQARYNMEIDKLEFENAKLKLQHQLDRKRLAYDASGLAFNWIQKFVVQFLGSKVKK